MPVDYRAGALNRLYYKARPIRPSRAVGPSRWRVPDSGPVAPRLKEPPVTSAIGFHHNFEEASRWEIGDCEFVAEYQPATPPLRIEYRDGTPTYIIGGGLYDRKV